MEEKGLEIIQWIHSRQELAGIYQSSGFIIEATSKEARCCRRHCRVSQPRPANGPACRSVWIQQSGSFDRLCDFKSL